MIECTSVNVLDLVLCFFQDPFKIEDGEDN